MVNFKLAPFLTFFFRESFNSSSRSTSVTSSTSTPKQQAKKTARKPAGVKPILAAKVTSVKRVPSTSNASAVKSFPSRNFHVKKTIAREVSRDAVRTEKKKSTVGGDILAQLTDWHKKDLNDRKVSEKQGEIEYHSSIMY